MHRPGHQSHSWLLFLLHPILDPAANPTSSPFKLLTVTYKVLHDLLLTDLNSDPSPESTVHQSQWPHSLPQAQIKGWIPSAWPTSCPETVIWVFQHEVTSKIKCPISYHSSVSGYMWLLAVTIILQSGDIPYRAGKEITKHGNAFYTCSQGRTYLKPMARDRHCSKPGNIWWQSEVSFPFLTHPKLHPILLMRKIPAHLRFPFPASDLPHNTKLIHKTPLTYTAFSALPAYRRPSALL